MKVAIVCDWLTGVGGAELVVLEFHKLYPEAPIYTSQYDPKSIDWFKKADVRTLWLQKLPKSLKKFLPYLRGRAFSKLDLSEYDLVLSSSGAEAKFVKTGARTIHICYCHAPTHYYWSRYDDYIKNPGFGPLNFLARFGLKLLVGNLRRKDLAAAKRPDFLIGNSTHIQKEIKKYYERESSVIHPPVDVDYFKSKRANKRHGFVVAGRQTPYKQINLAVQACTNLGLPLTVIGNGPEHAKLKSIAGPTVRFTGHASREQVRAYFQTAEAFIFPGLDDFGIVAVEALAAGTPVVAYKAGGALDYVQPEKNGLFFDKPSVSSLEATLKKFQDLSFVPESVMATAKPFDEQRFKKELRTFIREHVSAH